MTLCRVCEWRRATRKGLCQTCYRWRASYKLDRPESQVVAPGRRLSRPFGARSPYPYLIRWEWDGKPEESLSLRTYKELDVALELAESGSRDYRSLTAYVVDMRRASTVSVYRRGRNVSVPRARIAG